MAIFSISCCLITRYSYALFKTNAAFGRSLTLIEEVDCHSPFLSVYLLWRDTVLNSVSSPVFLIPVFLQIVALITPVLNFISGLFSILLPHSLSDFISNFP